MIDTPFVKYCVQCKIGGINKMSHKSTSEYIAVKRKKYLCTSRAKKSQILDEVQETTGFTRKYVTNLLNGNIRHRARKGRGKTYGPKVAVTLANIWREAGCPCAPYRRWASKCGWTSLSNTWPMLTRRRSS